MTAIINLKENKATVEQALANLQSEIEIALKYKFTALKIIHGYGSHGTGGAIFLAVRKYLNKLLIKKQISDIIAGNQWALQNEKTRKLLYLSPEWASDEDLNHSNPGITIIVF
ncbi:MAG: Smr/MutS family protein [Clostridia bacterium]|jgi:hypothetical protein|nr:Smr/MutS family protein [Clostridia bacterium]